MEFIKHLIKAKLLDQMMAAYVQSKTGLIKERNLTYEDLLLLHSILPEDIVCAQYNEFTGGADQYDSISHYPVTDEIRAIYKEFPENSDIIPIRLEGDRLYVASASKERNMLDDQVELLTAMVNLSATKGSVTDSAFT